MVWHKVGSLMCVQLYDRVCREQRLGCVLCWAGFTTAGWLLHPQPSSAPAAVSQLGVRWVRSQQTDEQLDPERPIPSLLTVLKLEAMHDCVTRGSTLEAATLRLEIIKRAGPRLRSSRPTPPATARKASSMELHFAGHNDLRIPEIFVPAAVFAPALLTLRKAQRLCGNWKAI